jgi:hypothetical protein
VQLAARSARSPDSWITQPGAAKLVPTFEGKSLSANAWHRPLDLSQWIQAPRCVAHCRFHGMGDSHESASGDGPKSIAFTGRSPSQTAIALPNRVTGRERRSQIRSWMVMLGFYRSYFLVALFQSQGRRI